MFLLCLWLAAIAKGGRNLIHGVLTIAEKHISVILKENWVFKIRVTATHGSLAKDDLLGAPHLNDRHAVDGAALHGLGRGIRNIVSADNHAHVNIAHLGVDLVHLLDDIIRHIGLSEQHIHLSRHAAGDGVDAELDSLAHALALAEHIRHGHLGTTGSHTITRDDENLVGVSQKLGDGFRSRFAMLLDDLVTLLNGGDGVHTAEDNVEDVTVHGFAHDVRKDSS